MASELSSNWKKLQAKIKAEPTTTTSAPKKRPAPYSIETKTTQSKRPRTGQKSQGAPRRPARAGKPGSSTALPPKASSSKMGISQSSQPVPDVVKTSHKLTPSLALWAADNDISPEDIAQAYGLGTGPSKSLLSSSSSLKSATESRPNAGLTLNLEVGKYVGMDCEMVGVGDGGRESALARVSIVDFHGRQVYDSFVRPKERVADWRTAVSGVSAKDMPSARTFEEVQSQVAELIKGRIVVGHDLRHDMQALMLDHPLKLVRDTARYSGFKKYGHGRKPALRNLAREILGVEIQKGQHSSIEDARVAMLLFRRFKPSFDVEHANRFPDTVPQSSKPRSSGKPKKKKHR